MVNVRQTGDGKWIVADDYDGEKLAGPFDKEGDAYQAVSAAKKKAEKKTDKRWEEYQAKRRREGRTR